MGADTAVRYSIQNVTDVLCFSVLILGGLYVKKYSLNYNMFTMKQNKSQPITSEC